MQYVPYRAAWRFNASNMLLASTRRMASADPNWNTCRMLCTAALQPPLWPAQSWTDSMMSRMSGFKTERTAMHINLWHDSPMAIGCTPGFLFKAISRHESSARRPIGSMYGVHITVCMALLVFVLCQPVHSCIEPSLHGLDFFICRLVSALFG